MPGRDDALTLRIVELQSVLKQQRDELEEQKALLEHNRQIARDHEEIIRMQESQLLERDAQLQAQNAEIRALKRQHTLDAEALRAYHMQLHGNRRPSGSMGTPRMMQQAGRRSRGQMSPGGMIGGAPPPTSPDMAKSPSSKAAASPGSATRNQLKQAIADKVVLVRALHQLTAEMAHARAEAKQYAAVSERSLSTAWRLGQLGQLGLALLETDGPEEDGDVGSQRWNDLIDNTSSPPPFEELLGGALPDHMQDGDEG